MGLLGFLIMREVSGGGNTGEGNVSSGRVRDELTVVILTIGWVMGGSVKDLGEGVVEGLLNKGSGEGDGFSWRSLCVVGECEREGAGVEGAELGSSIRLAALWRLAVAATRCSGRAWSAAAGTGLAGMVGW
ncbi:hypothetical protein V6N11_036535 [Hibiscus sabdariffa]|uniref:Uncharacterized protein n=1 Tax=Hibiscus sabdariffa TaxID=183260 RepID=A0ABR2RAP2_9ROSI